MLAAAMSPPSTKTNCMRCRPAERGGQVTSVWRHFGYQRVAIYIEPKNGQENRLTPTTARTTLLLNDEPLPWVEWAAEFREEMPEPLKKLVEEMGASSADRDHHQSIRERLKQILDLFKVTRYRPVVTSPLMVEDAIVGLGGVAQESGENPRSGKRRGGSGGSGGRAGDIYTLFQATAGKPGEAIKRDIIQPNVKWVSVLDNTRTPSFLENRAAKYLPDQTLLLINADFRVFTDMVERWCGKYSHVPGARPIIESVVHEWFEQQLIESVMGTLALRGSAQWTTPDLENLWSEEGLTAVVLPRYHIDYSVRRSLGTRIGSLKEHVA